MFKYGNTGRQSTPKEKQIKRVIEVRKVTYINPNPDKKKKDEPIITEGFETVREITIDPKSDFDEATVVVGHKTVTVQPKIVKRKKNALEEKEHGSN